MPSLNKFTRTKSVIPYLLFLLTLCWASFSDASVHCSPRNASSITINLGDITVPDDLPVGGDITGDKSYSQNLMAQCEGDGPSYITLYSDLSSDAVYNGRSTFKTNIPGVGIQMGGTINNLSAWMSNGNTQQQLVEFTLHLLTVPIENYLYGPMFKLVKISDDIESGTLSGKANHVIVSGSASSTTYTVYLSGTINATPPHVPGCTVETSSTPVALGTHSPAEFSGVGSTTAFTNFSIPLTCESDAQITAQVDATQDPSGAQSVIQIPTGEENASGVGVQLYWASLNSSANVPVEFGKPVFVGESSGGTENLQFEARYYQTQNALFPGDANASATVTLSYQ